MFSVGENGAEFVPGMVRYDGAIVEIDLTSQTALVSGLLIFQLLNGDGDGASVVRVRSLVNVVDPDGIASPVFPLRPVVVGAGDEIDLTALSAAQDVQALVNNVRFDPASGRYMAEIRVQNPEAATGRQVAAVFPGLRPGVDLIDPSGSDPSGSPYINMAPAVPFGGLPAGIMSDAVQLEINNPSLKRFSLNPEILAGGPNQAPAFDPVGPLTVMPGGHLEVSLSATDPDGDPVLFSIRNEDPLPNGRLENNETLVFNPMPGQEGTYSFTLVASDGVLDQRGVDRIP